MRHEFVPLPCKKHDRIPPVRFAVPKSCTIHGRWQFLGYCHGLAGMLNVCRREVVVWDPLAGQQHRVPFPPGLCSSEGRVCGYGTPRCCVLMLMSNVVVLATFFGDFVLLLESMRFRRISERNGWDNAIHYAYRNFYTAGRGVGWKWLDLKL